jgi:hypothetical protein
MTWVLGKPFHQDAYVYSLLISDVCVTYTDSTTGKKICKDCLLKVHDISTENGLIVGFAGRVEHAFNIIDDMRILAASMSLKSANRKFDVLDFIIEWRKYTTQNKKHLYPNDNEHGVHMLIAGNHTENNSTGNKYIPCAVYKIEAPDYRPMSVHPFHWMDIGSGKSMTVCKQIADQLSNDFRFRVLAIDNSPTDMVDFLAPKISAALEQGKVQPGVSKQLVIGISTVGDTGIAATFRTDSGNSSPMDKLATTYEELDQMLSGGDAKAVYFG